MSRVAFIEGGADLAAAHLARRGWRVINLAAAPLSDLVDRPDLIVGEIRTFCADQDLRRLAALRAMSPDLPMVVIAASLDADAGPPLYEVLTDVPIIRRGGEDDLLDLAIAAA